MYLCPGKVHPLFGFGSLPIALWISTPFPAIFLDRLFVVESTNWSKYCLPIDFILYLAKSDIIPPATPYRPKLNSPLAPAASPLTISSSNPAPFISFWDRKNGIWWRYIHYIYISLLVYHFELSQESHYLGHTGSSFSVERSMIASILYPVIK